MQVISLINESSVVGADEFAAVAVALNIQIQRDFGPAWGVSARLGYVRPGGKPRPGTWWLVIADTSDQAGALGYHDLTPDGLPIGKVFAKTDQQYGAKWSVTASHEATEMLGDPWINLCAQADDGKFYAYEAADAVEADELGYEINGITVSDFVYPAWFGHGAGRVDHAGHISEPFELAPGGYISVFDPATGQGWTQVMADKDRSPTEAIATRPRVGSRRERRFVGRDRWVLSTVETDENAEVLVLPEPSNGQREDRLADRLRVEASRAPWASRVLLDDELLHGVTAVEVTSRFAGKEPEQTILTLTLLGAVEVSRAPD